MKRKAYVFYFFKSTHKYIYTNDTDDRTWLQVMNIKILAVKKERN